MINEQKLNSLVELAKDGCKDALWEIRAMFHGDILKLSEDNAHRLKCQFSFEETCFTRISTAIRRFDPQRGSFSRYVRFLLHQLANLYVSRSKMLQTVSLEGMYDSDDDDAPKGFDPIDGLATVDEEFLLNEKITLLAEGDSRKLAILNVWKLEYNDSEAALFLAKQYGGKTESHRKFVSRFKTKCQDALANAI